LSSNNHNNTEKNKKERILDLEDSGQKSTQRAVPHRTVIHRSASKDSDTNRSTFRTLDGNIQGSIGAINYDNKKSKKSNKSISRGSTSVRSHSNPKIIMTDDIDISA